MEASAPVAVGELLAGKYRIERVLGTGGMGVVVAATHEELDQRVAIKFLLPAGLANAEVVARFKREARAAVKIQSEHVARVIDVGTLASGAPYMVMEYLEGSDLAQKIADVKQLAVGEAVQYVLEACEALAEAHAAGIVHRDLKPANLFLARRADKTAMVKVLDFGISKVAAGDKGGGITSTQAVMGSPYYMSPEQLMSAKHVDHRSDIWSLGIVLYESLVGTPPYLGDSMPEIVARILQGTTPSVCATRGDVQPELDAVIATCLSKDASARYRDVAELAEALVAFAPSGQRSVDRISRVLGTSVRSSGQTTAAMPLQNRVTPISANQEQASTSPAWTGAEHELPKRSSGLIFGSIAVGLGVLGVIVFIALRRHDGVPTPASGVVVSVTTPDIRVSTNIAIPPVPTDVVVQATSPLAPTPTPTTVVRTGSSLHVQPTAASAKVVVAVASSPAVITAVTAATPPPPQTSQGTLHMGIK